MSSDEAQVGGAQEDAYVELPYEVAVRVTINP
jgi:hypothetical protein